MNLCKEHQMPLCRTCSGKKRRKSPSLKRTQKPRPMSGEAMATLVDRVMLRDGRCVACDLDTAMCDGQTDAAHLVSQRQLKAHYSGDELTRILADDRNVVALCRTHHGLMDRGFLRLPEEVMPLGFPAFLREFGFEAFWDGEIERRVA